MAKLETIIRQSSERYSVPLQEAVCHRSDNSDCRSDGHYPDHIDLAAVAIDPIDDATMWMTHAFRDGALTDPKKMYRMVIGKLKP